MGSRRWLVGLACAASVALADVPPPEPDRPPDASCLGLQPGASCGNGGTCRSLRVRRPDYSQGVPPTWGWTEVLVCEGQGEREPEASPELADEPGVTPAPPKPPMTPEPTPASCASLGGVAAVLAALWWLALRRPGRAVA